MTEEEEFFCFKIVDRTYTKNWLAEYVMVNFLDNNVHRMKVFFNEENIIKGYEISMSENIPYSKNIKRALKQENQDLVKDKVSFIDFMLLRDNLVNFINSHKL